MKRKINQLVACLGLSMLLLATQASAGSTPLDITTAAPLMAQGDAVVETKNEVVYATLFASGEVGAVYVVNHFELAQPGTVTDYGRYQAVQSLTNSEGLQQVDDAISFTADKANYYYQGTLDSKQLPWQFTIHYTLDGVKKAPAELAGQSGELAIEIITQRQPGIDPVFYDNYMLQISLTLNTERTSHLVAEGATIASAGNNKIITYTVLPGKDAHLRLSANVRDFSMSGVEMAAMPFSMSMDLPDTDDMLDDLKALPKAIASLYGGVGQMKDGVDALKQGAQGLIAGSADIDQGLLGLNSGGQSIAQGSAGIQAGLGQIVQSLSGGGQVPDLSALTGLPTQLGQLSDALTQTKDALVGLQSTFDTAYQALGSAIEDLPSTTITAAQITALKANADTGQHDLIDQLYASHTAAQAVRTAYAQHKTALDGVSTTLTGLVSGLNTTIGGLDALAQGLSTALANMDLVQQMAQLSQGMTQLANSYAQFHSGLTAYLGGVGQLATNYGQFHGGLVDYGTGVGQVAEGMQSLHGGMGTLNGEMKKLPGRMQKEMDALMDEYLGGEFEPRSFTSTQNTKTGLVQFVLRFEGIEPLEKASVPGEAPIQLTFWDRLVALFK